MTIYLLNIALLCLWGIILYKKKNGDKYYCLIITTQLLFLSCVRSIQTGGDLISYKLGFDAVQSISWDKLYTLKGISFYGNIETGWHYLAKALSLIANNFRIVIVFNGALLMTIIGLFIYQNSRCKWLSFYLFITLGYYGHSLSAIRQYLAISILIISMNFVKKRKLLSFLACIFLASLFHKTALCFAIVYLYPMFKLTKKYWCISAIFAFISLLASKPILNLIINLAGYESYRKYIGNGNGEGMLLMLSAYLIIVVIYRKQLQKTEKNYTLYISMLVTAIILNISALQFLLMGRLMEYFHIILIILLPNTLACIQNYRTKYVGTLIICLLTLIYYLLFICRLDTSGLIPYRFMW